MQKVCVTTHEPREDEVDIGCEQRQQLDSGREDEFNYEEGEKRKKAKMRLPRQELLCRTSRVPAQGVGAAPRWESRPTIIRPA